MSKSYSQIFLSANAFAMSVLDARAEQATSKTKSQLAIAMWLPYFLKLQLPSGTHQARCLLSPGKMGEPSAI